MTSQEPRTAAGRKLLRYLSGLEGGVEPPQWAKDLMAADILAIEAEAANGSALDATDALLELVGILNRHPEAYRLDSGELGGAYVAALIRARSVARLTGSPDPAALADRLVEEGRVSVWGRPGTKFTAKRAKAPDPEATP